METKQEPVDDVCESSQSVDELSQSNNWEAEEEVDILTTPSVKQEVMGEMEKDQTKPSGRKKGRKKKRSEIRRLLKFQEGLMKVCGLDPSKLMRGLAREFDQI